jgi:hypothetical protein
VFCLHTVVNEFDRREVDWVQLKMMFSRLMCSESSVSRKESDLKLVDLT